MADSVNATVYAASDHGRRMGHEFLGVVEDTGSDVSGLERGDVVVAPFVWADNTCDFCRQGLQPSCRHGGQWGHDLDGAPSGSRSWAGTRTAPTRPRFRRHRRHRRARRRGRRTGPGAHRRRRHRHRARVRRHKAGHRDVDRRGARRWRDRQGRRRSVHGGADGLRHRDVEPGRVFDRTVSLDEVPDGYRAMADRGALEVRIRP